MCGIAGIIQPGRDRFGKEHLSAMTAALAHRGPEGAGLWESPCGNALLGHRRLSIIDLSPAASQPMHYGHNEEQRYTIVFNGAIYNYVELQSDLKTKGYQFHSASDTEVILAAYDFYGEDCVDHFDGMFAFAIWDEQEKELFAARDRFGEKPFFYWTDGNCLVFASEMKALWEAGIPRIPNLRMFFNFLTIGYADNPENPTETFYEDISRLPAASKLFFQPGQGEVEIEKYWSIDPSQQRKKINVQEAIEEFGQLLSGSVSRRLRSDVTVGTSLSGGLDSSSIMAEISSSSQLNGELNSFSAIFPGFEKDESVFAAKVAEKFGSKQHTVAITADDLVNDWTQFLHHQEEPAGSASAYAQFRVFKLAKEMGVTVLLDGQGADETLAGYSKYYKWYWQELFQKRRLVRSGELKASKALGVSESFGMRNVVAALFPDIASVLLERQYLVNALRHEELTREFVRLQSREAYYSTPEQFNLNGVLHFNTCVHGLEELLRYADRNSMAHGREVRLPFLYHKLVEFVFSLPSDFKIREGWTKWILRKTMDGRLPDEITWRKTKVGFEPPQERWMEDRRVIEMMYEAKRKLVEEKILRPSVLNRSAKPHSAHAEDADDWRYLAAAFYL